MRRRTEGQRGFTLVEAAVAIAVVAILMGFLVPLAGKALNQQREGRTREALKQAFEAMFGARDRRVANLRADVGFNPGAALGNLSVLTSKSGAIAATKDYGLDATYGIYWGYNGPYWSGSIVGANPADGWGRPMQLRVVGGSWQVWSLGANGIAETGAAATTPGGDDLLYPAVPGQPAAHTGVLNVTVNFTGQKSGNVTAYVRNPTGTAMVTTNYNIPAVGTGAQYTFTNSYSLPTLTYNFPAGGVALVVNITSAPTVTQYYAFDLLPGEVRDFQIQIGL